MQAAQGDSPHKIVRRRAAMRRDYVVRGLLFISSRLLLKEKEKASISSFRKKTPLEKTSI